MDTIVAAVAEANGCMIVTDNTRDFHGITVLDPIGDDRGAGCFVPRRRPC